MWQGVLQGLRCEWGAGVLNFVLSLTLSHTSHWKFNTAPHGKELSEDLKKRIVALHKDGLGYKKIANTLKLSCSTVAKTMQRFTRTGSTRNRNRHGRPKKFSARSLTSTSSVMSSWRSGRGFQWQPVKLLVNSMPKRVKAVLKNTGGHTKYWHFGHDLDIFIWGCNV